MPFNSEDFEFTEEERVYIRANGFPFEIAPNDEECLSYSGSPVKCPYCNKRRGVTVYQLVEWEGDVPKIVQKIVAPAMKLHIRLNHPGRVL